MNDDKLARAGEPDLDIIEGEEPEARWQINSIEELAWAMERLARAEVEKSQVEAIFVAGQKKLDDWRLARLASVEAGTAFLLSEVNRYAFENRAALTKGKTKTIDLPAGTISWRKTGGGWP